MYSLFCLNITCGILLNLNKYNSQIYPSFTHTHTHTYAHNSLKKKIIFISHSFFLSHPIFRSFPHFPIYSKSIHIVRKILPVL